MSAFSPRRLLQLSASGVKLLDNVIVDHWACLSYCWGSIPSEVKLTSQNLDIYRHGIPFDALPNLYQDTIKVCKWLDVHYLWIDALCIIQDRKDDWIEQAADMAQIYAHGVFTIAAEEASDPLSNMLSLVYESFPWSPVRGFDSTYVRQTESSLTDLTRKGEGVEVAQKPEQPRILNTRAWTYQEIELSPRVIRFRREEIIWECCKNKSRSSKLQETFEIATTYKTKRLCTIQDQPDWYTIVNSYSERELTVDSDKLPALAAVAEYFDARSRDAGQYLAGLWGRTIIDDLLWRLHHARSASRPVPASDLTSSTIPSWSWASVKTPVFYSAPDYRSLRLAEILDIDVRYHGSPYLGLTTKAAISLEARYIVFQFKSTDSFCMTPVAQAKWKIKDAPRIRHVLFTGSYDDLVDRFYYCIDTEEDERLIDSIVNGLESDVYFVLLRVTFEKVTGILLHQYLESPSYRRIGWCLMMMQSYEIARLWRKRYLQADHGHLKDSEFKEELEKGSELTHSSLGRLPLGKFTIE